MRHVARAAVALAVATSLAACGTAPRHADGDAPPGTSPHELTEPATPSADNLIGTVTVLAAASLTEAFTALGERFEELHPGVDVVLSFGGSTTLAHQVLAGAPADVLATADPSSMATVTEAGAAAAPPAVLARNTLEIAVPRGNPAGVTTLADLAGPDVTVAMCAPEVPCGAVAAKLLRVTGLAVTPVTLEKDVRAVLTKVRLGEVDAGLVYRTDVIAASPAVDGVPVPDAHDAATEYVIAPVAEAPNPEAAEAFVTLALDEAGRDALRSAGFELP